MVVIKCNAKLSPEQQYRVTCDMHEQAATGVIVLPDCCDVLHADLEDRELIIKYADGRVAPLTVKSDCETCKNVPNCHHNHGTRGIVRINCPLWRPR